MKEKKLYLPYLFSALARASFEGKLALIEGDIQRTIYFRQGKVVNVVSQLQEETLGRCLLDEGKITQEAYHQLLEQIIKTGQSAGQLLISSGALNPQEVFLALERQVKRKLLNCFKMSDFGFDLTRGPVPPARGRRGEQLLFLQRAAHLGHHQGGRADRGR